jgi:glutamyl-tRNA reductase
LSCRILFQKEDEAMNLLVLGCSYRTTPVEIREKLAFDESQLVRALEHLSAQMSCEAVILSTCNRVELYLGLPFPEASEEASGFLSVFHCLSADEVRPHLYEFHDREAVRHLFRVAASLDSLVVGEGQIAGQVKKAYEHALTQGSTGPLLNALFPHARRVAKRVRTETGISQGSVSVSSAAVDYVRQVFDQFGDKRILVIGAGKMGELTLKHLRALAPREILVTNRSPDKAQAVARGCGGSAVPWEKLDEVLVGADIILSTTGASEPVVTRQRFAQIKARRAGRQVVILDIAVPRDFDPRIHDGDQTFLFNIDDLKAIRESTLARRREHVGAAEGIVDQEAHRFVKDWARRRNGPVIDRLMREFETGRKEIMQQIFGRLNDRLTKEDREYIEKTISRWQNKILHGPISALSDETHAGGGHTLLDALRKLFRLQD